MRDVPKSKKSGMAEVLQLRRPKVVTPAVRAALAKELGVDPATLDDDQIVEAAEIAEIVNGLGVAVAPAWLEAARRIYDRVGGALAHLETMHTAGTVDVDGESERDAAATLIVETDLVLRFVDAFGATAATHQLGLMWSWLDTFNERLPAGLRSRSETWKVIVLGELLTNGAIDVVEVRGRKMQGHRDVDREALRSLLIEFRHEKRKRSVYKIAADIWERLSGKRLSPDMMRKARASVHDV